jgi:hypothetical protein
MGRKPRTGVRAVSASSIEISFTYQGQCCREKINFQPTPANLKCTERHRADLRSPILRQGLAGGARSPSREMNANSPEKSSRIPNNAPDRPAIDEECFAYPHAVFALPLFAGQS